MCYTQIRDVAASRPLRGPDRGVGHRLSVPERCGSAGPAGRRILRQMVPGAPARPGEGAAVPDPAARSDRQGRLCDRLLPHAHLQQQLSGVELAARRVHCAAVQVSIHTIIGWTQYYPQTLNITWIFFRYKKNLKAFYIVHPTFWTKVNAIFNHIRQSGCT